MRIIRAAPTHNKDTNTKTINSTCSVCMLSVLYDGTSFFDPKLRPFGRVQLVAHPHKPGEGTHKDLQDHAKSHAYGKTPTNRGWSRD